MALLPVEVIDLGAFSKTPGGRYRADGKFSGQEFREEWLEPILRFGTEITIDLDAPIGMTSGFLEEVFGGLVRTFGPEIVHRVGVRADTHPNRRTKALQLMERAVKAR